MLSESVYGEGVCLDEDDPELRRAWNTFADPVTEHGGEAWQYMGTQHREGSWRHSFRHRCHPATSRRVLTEVPAPFGWEPLA